VTGPGTALEEPPRARTDLEVGEVTGWTFVFDRSTRRLHRLNPTAASVFELLDGTTGTGALIDVLAEGYGVDPSTIAADVRAILADFASEGLLTGGPDPSPTGAPVPTVRGQDPRPSRLAPCLDRLLAARPDTLDLGPYAAMGFRFRVLTDDAESAEALDRILASLAEGPTGPPPPSPFGRPPLRTYHLRVLDGSPPTWRLHLDATRIHTTHGRGLAIDHLLWHLNRMAVLTCSTDTVFHAGAVTDGRHAALLPGESNAGKSTLVTGLVAGGLGYLSDEAVLLDADDRAWPYPKAVDLDPGSWPVFPELAPTEDEADLHRIRWHVAPDRIRPGAAGPPSTVRAILSPRYEAGATPRLEPFAPEEAFGLLLEQAFHVGDRAGAIEQVARLVESVPCHRVVSGQLDGAVALVRDVLASA
jgi:hypothetical protein